MTNSPTALLFDTTKCRPTLLKIRPSFIHRWWQRMLNGTYNRPQFSFLFQMGEKSSGAIPRSSLVMGRLTRSYFLWDSFDSQYINVINTKQRPPQDNTTTSTPRSQVWSYFPKPPSLPALLLLLQLWATLCMLRTSSYDTDLWRVPVIFETTAPNLLGSGIGALGVHPPSTLSSVLAKQVRTSHIQVTMSISPELRQDMKMTTRPRFYAIGWFFRVPAKSMHQNWMMTD